MMRALGWLANKLTALLHAIVLGPLDAGDALYNFYRLKIRKPR